MTDLGPKWARYARHYRIRMGVPAEQSLLPIPSIACLVCLTTSTPDSLSGG